MSMQSIEDRAVEMAARPYTRLIHPDPEEGGYTVVFLEFSGTVAEGETLDEAWANADDALVGTLEVMLETGRAIPQPFAERTFSGKLQLRLPPAVHERAAELATIEGISLNRWLSQAVAQAAASWRTPTATPSGALRTAAETEDSYSSAG